MALVVQRKAIDHAGTRLIGAPHLDVNATATEFQDSLIQRVDR